MKLEELFETDAKDPARKDMMAAVPRISDKAKAVKSKKREKQIYNRAARSTTGKNIPDYEKYPTSKTKD